MRFYKEPAMSQTNLPELAVIVGSIAAAFWLLGCSQTQDDAWQAKDLAAAKQAGYSQGVQDGREQVARTMLDQCLAISAQERKVANVLRMHDVCWESHDAAMLDDEDTSDDPAQADEVVGKGAGVKA
jgi:Flp pilus assembly secretin CpaC